MIYKNAELHNVRALIPSEKESGLWMSRLPEEVRTKINPKAQEIAFNGCGCEIRFNLLGEKARIVLRRDAAEGIQERGVLEIYRGSFQDSYEMSPHYIGNDEYEIVIDNNADALNVLRQNNESPFDPYLVRILLPFDWRCTIVSLEGEISPPTPGQTPERKLLAYGSSITHGGCSLTPSGTYAMRTASRLGMDLLNLGFAGSALLDPEVADFIAYNPEWDMAILELGVNMVDTWSPDEFAQRVERFVTTIAEHNQDKFIFCTDIFTMKMDVERNPKVDVFRGIVRSLVERLNLPKLIHLSGKELFPNPMLLTTDLVHPSAQGMETISAHFVDAIIKAGGVRK